MVFKRRTPRGWVQTFIEFFYPRGGWYRAAQYVIHRVRRLPDAPHRIGRGVFAGVFISFTPLFGFHFIGAALIALAIRGNVLAALLATFIGNPLTTPIIAYTSVELGQFILGGHGSLRFEEILVRVQRRDEGAVAKCLRAVHARTDALARAWRVFPDDLSALSGRGDRAGRPDRADLPVADAAADRGLQEATHQTAA